MVDALLEDERITQSSSTCTSASSPRCSPWANRTMLARMS